MVEQTEPNFPDGAPRIRFGPFEYDPRKRLLLRDGKRVPNITGIPLKALDFVLRNRDRLVTYDELIQAAWEGETAGKSDNDVQKRVRPVFSSLTSTGHEFIEVVPGLGYRFIPLPSEILPETRPLERPTIGEPPRPDFSWHVPYSRNALFKGREDELQCLHDGSKEKNNRRVIQVLAALPGLGKTSIAVEYAYRFRKDYALVWWLDASSESSLLKEYEVLASRLDTRYGPHGQKSLGAIHHISDRLSTLSDWLLIFDNVSSAENVGPHLPTTGTGHIIITAADRHWKGIATVYDVGPLDPPEAMAFLNDRLAGIPATFGTDLVPELAAELSYIPAALDIASTYLELTCCPIANYIQRLRALRRKSFLLLGIEQSAELVVAETWNLTLARAQCETPTAYILLRLFEWLDDCEIPIDFIEQIDAESEHEGVWRKLSTRISMRMLVWLYRRRLGPPTPPLPPLRASGYVDAFRKGFVTLQRYSIVKQSGSTFTIPPLIKVLIRTRQLKWQQKFWARIGPKFTEQYAWAAISRNDSESAALWILHLRTGIQHSATLAISDDLEKTRHNANALEERLTNPTVGTTYAEPVAPVRLSFRALYFVLKQLRQEFLPMYWALLCSTVSCIFCGLCFLGVCSVILYAQKYGVLPRHGLLWFRICVVLGLLSAVAWIVFFQIHLRLKRKMPANSSEDG